MLLGAGYLLLVDTLARSLTAVETQLGITALIGTPFFLWLLARTDRLGPMRLEAVALDVGYPGKPVGRGINLAVGPGEVPCLLGPNGSGKSTLFRTLLGLIPAQGGSLLLAGRPLQAFGRRELARRMAYVPQAPSTQFAYSVLDIVLMGRAAHLGPFVALGENDVDSARRALALGIGALADADYGRISGGQRQLALIAPALAQASHPY